MPPTRNVPTAGGGCAPLPPALRSAGGGFPNELHPLARRGGGAGFVSAPPPADAARSCCVAASVTVPTPSPPAVETHRAFDGGHPPGVSIKPSGAWAAPPPRRTQIHRGVIQQRSTRNDACRHADATCRPSILPLPSPVQQRNPRHRTHQRTHGDARQLRQRRVAPGTATGRRRHAPSPRVAWCSNEAPA